LETRIKYWEADVERFHELAARRKLTINEQQNLANLQHNIANAQKQIAKIVAAR